LERPAFASFGSIAARQGDQLGFGFPIEPSSFGSGGSRSTFTSLGDRLALALAHKLLPNPLDLSLGDLDQFRDGGVRATPFRMVHIREQ
jgi:hypothetical protein